MERGQSQPKRSVEVTKVGGDESGRRRPDADPGWVVGGCDGWRSSLKCRRPDPRCQVIDGNHSGPFGRFDTHQFARAAPFIHGGCGHHAANAQSKRRSPFMCQSASLSRRTPTKGGRGRRYQQSLRRCPGPQAGLSRSTRSTTPGIRYPHGPTYRDETGLAGAGGRG